MRDKLLATFSLWSRLCLLVMASGCTEKRAVNQVRDLPAPVIRDSAGVRIVVYPNLGPGPALFETKPQNPLIPRLEYARQIEIESTPFLTIGGPDVGEEAELSSRNSNFTTLQLSNGTIVIANHTRLMFYRADGTFFRAVGRSGRGPGEFRAMSSVCATEGDTVLVTDLYDGRVSLWSGTGDHIRTFARPGDVVLGTCAPTASIIVRDVTKIDATKPQSASSSNSKEVWLPFHLVRPDGSVVRDLGTHPAILQGSSQPLTMFALSKTEYTVGFGKTFELRTYDLDGRLRRISRLGRERDPITEEEWAARAPHPPSDSPDPIKADQMRRAWIARGHPVRFPAYMELRLDRQQRLWVADWGSQANWTVFDSTGVILGRYDVGGAMMGAKLVGFGRDYIAVTSYSSDGSPSVKFYPFGPATPAPG